MVYIGLVAAGFSHQTYDLFEEFNIVAVCLR